MTIAIAIQQWPAGLIAVHVRDSSDVFGSFEAQGPCNYTEHKPSLHFFFPFLFWRFP
jgi:hypothetical protein